MHACRKVTSHQLDRIHLDLACFNPVLVCRLITNRQARKLVGAGRSIAIRAGDRFQESATEALLILGRFLNVVDDVKLHRSPLRYQLQTDLLL